MRAMTTVPSNSYQRTNERFSAWLTRHAAATVGLVAVALWAFAEATFWFIAPDFLIMILCAAAPRAWKRIVLWALAGSLVGGVVCFALNTFFLDEMGQILRATPFVQERMITEIDSLYSKLGPQAVLHQSFSFMQFKIWTHLAVLHGFQPILYFLLVMVSRAVRLGLVGLAAHLVGTLPARLPLAPRDCVGRALHRRLRGHAARHGRPLNTTELKPLRRGVN